MAGVNGAEVSFHLVEQTSPTSGIPASPVWEELRRVDGDFGKAKTLSQSNEVDSTGQAAQYAATASEVTGSFNDEFPIADIPTQKILESVMRGTQTADLAISASTISTTAGGLNDTAGSFANINVGDYIRVGGFTGDTANNRIYKVTAKADNDNITTSPAPNSVEAAGDTVTIKGNRITNSNTQKAFGVQKRIPFDSGTIYETFEGVQFGTFGLNVTASSFVTISYSGLGLTQLSGTGQVAGSTDTAVSTADITSSVTDVAYWIDDAPAVVTDLNYLESSFTLDNGLSSVNVVGLEGAGCLQHSSINVTGTLTSIAQDYTEKTKFENETRFNIGIEITDDDGNTIIFDFPQTLYTELPQPNTANADLLENQGAVAAEKDDTLGYTVGVFYLPA